MAVWFAAQRLRGFRPAACKLLGLSRCRGTTTFAAFPQPVDLDPTQLLVADFQHLSIEELNDIRVGLWRALKDIRLPRPTSFNAFGKEYQLPYFVKETPVETPSEDILEYLSGFFAGDGCVRSDLSGLRVNQSEVLFLYASLFGGSIGVGNSGSGTSFPCLHWQVSGEKAQRAAELLGKAQLEKQAQLLQFVRVSDDELQTVQMMMRLWRKMPTAVQIPKLVRSGRLRRCGRVLCCKADGRVDVPPEAQSLSRWVAAILFGAAWNSSLHHTAHPRQHLKPYGQSEVNAADVPGTPPGWFAAEEGPSRVGARPHNRTTPRTSFQASGAERESRPIPPDE